MSRQAWTPETATAEQLRLRQAAIDAFRLADENEERAYDLAARAHEAGVPMEDLAEQTGRSRATLFRRKRPTQTGRKSKR